mmetsp:Transcript_157955/g.506624  ORF Transcript_157955/g.506624 Transcript_157955/m.506624 type:complete len:207 (-) Transcript_157955:126-746(-)
MSLRRLALCLRVLRELPQGLQSHSPGPVLDARGQRDRSAGVRGRVVQHALDLRVQQRGRRLAALAGRHGGVRAPGLGDPGHRAARLCHRRLRSGTRARRRVRAPLVVEGRPRRADVAQQLRQSDHSRRLVGAGVRLAGWCGLQRVQEVEGGLQVVCSPLRPPPEQSTQGTHSTERGGKPVGETSRAGAKTHQIDGCWADAPLAFAH